MGVRLVCWNYGIDKEAPAQAEGGQELCVHSAWAELQASRQPPGEGEGAAGAKSSIRPRPTSPGVLPLAVVLAAPF